MDILDEVLNEPTQYLGGKKGFNQSDIIAAKRLIAEGFTTNDIAKSIGVRIDIVQKFVDHHTARPDPAEDEVVEKPVTKKKTKKKKSKKA